MFQQIVDVQRDIYLAFAGHIKEFAAGGGWASFLAFLPMGIVFGAAHAMTPGHSKSVLATYLTGSATTAHRALLVSLALSFTHVTMAVLIALLALPLVSHSFVDARSAPVLQAVSRGLLGLIGLWMVWSALFRRAHTHSSGEGVAVGFMAGLIPCPLTLFVMTFAMIHQVIITGLLFALSMMLGVSATLSAIALLAVMFREQFARLMSTGPRLLAVVSKSIEAAAGAILVAVAVHEIVFA
ncbi:sulfite exporter TauE/SafE family protein [Rhizobium leguminosarum]|uniref:Nickel/cobalt efflux system n=1 Tax=Rhizobium leguminosarum TaxID=384 RepID=A0A6P0BFS1_RHILE|nr:sulfite exporter TauE/SafE family protein [Rhizobium leguminosarum]MBY5441590.1 ABC transporter permease [Rhizobium leguminosarum]NEI38739.1 ABC transporter permease [Rhizobium leguminosarum]NEI45387.1 ABC transporter permease [Rhizobium leguminosarum]